MQPNRLTDSGRLLASCSDMHLDTMKMLIKGRGCDLDLRTSSCEALLDNTGKMETLAGTMTVSSRCQQNGANATQVDIY